MPKVRRRGGRCGETGRGGGGKLARRLPIGCCAAMSAARATAGASSSTLEARRGRGGAAAGASFCAASVAAACSAAAAAPSVAAVVAAMPSAGTNAARAKSRRTATRNPSLGRKPPRPSGLGGTPAKTLGLAGIITTRLDPEGAPGTALLVELDRTSGRLPPGVVPPVWVGADRFGRSKGIGLVFVRSAREAHKVVRLLDGFELNGRAVSARHDDSFARAQKIGLPRFEPLWLRKLAAGLGQRLGTEPEPVEPLVATNESIDTTGKAW